MVVKLMRPVGGVHFISPTMIHSFRPRHALKASRVHAFDRNDVDIATQSVDELSEMELGTLKSALETLVRSERYEEAALVRDALKVKMQKNPIVQLEMELEAAITQERYGDAALLRDQLRELAPPVLPDIPCTSSTKCTEGIRVTVHSSYAPAHSRPEISNYLFTYKITITNESHPTTVKLVSRRWTITDGGGRQREVIGQGVVGKFPEVKPGESFEYESACPLSTHSGSMEGEYEFYSRVSPDASWSSSFLVYVAKFELSVEGPPRLV